ncbi:hypothetical protein Q31b_07660 [Novipirellula aureliae]|uniref:Glycoside hydrolase family 5 domain-containing protein n=1 Tax=Novipirellula aureliae TaxID=2527966 RepID=A0A5C6ED04_9BACT|nr:cellulase family glycosylhydrolase [Novipirellula aureliae]TWU45591.1 hypothetical protein Q31b_07660 [Novipirellula aureliae]
MIFQNTLLTSFWATGIVLSFTGFSHAGGMNLPRTHGSSNQGAFLPGVYQYDYDEKDIARIQESHFDHFRMLVNVETCHDSEALTEMLTLFAKLGSRGIVCMNDTNQPGEIEHGNGRVNDLAEMAAAWKIVYERVKHLQDVKFEVFNEPFGYRSAEEYLQAMNTLIAKAGLPEERCILNGIGYAEDIQSVAKAGWTGDLAYHFYPNWLPRGQQSLGNYSQLIQTSLSGVSNDIYITEFGAALNRGDVYNASSTRNGNVLALQGLQDALRNLKKRGQHVKETYHWHGWDNGDSYSFWDKDNHFGAEKIRQIQEDP